MLAPEVAHALAVEPETALRRSHRVALFIDASSGSSTARRGG
jgi:hypothetical protein